MGPQTALLLKDLIPEMSMKDSRGLVESTGQSSELSIALLAGDHWPSG
jgi:hypothetical protein